MNKLDLYYVDLKYIRELSRADQNVMSVSPQIGKSNRPFVGVVIIANNNKYCVPLTSPKEKFNKKSQVDFIKIFDERTKNEHGAPKTIGIININNMIPVDDSVIKKIDLKINQHSDIKVNQAKALMQKQIKWCRNNFDVIQNRTNKVYRLVTEEPDKNRRLVARCLKFSELEKVSEKYISNKKTK